ncbi:MAG: hypothetical protein OXB94_05685 [Nitrospira sp.]|nr:hypothetical protein [Nitrospira sp.]
MTVVFLVWLMASVMLGVMFIWYPGNLILAVGAWIGWSVILGWSIYNRFSEWKTKMEKTVDDMSKKLDAILERLD